jgi:HTH-type transcriptional regulator, transcriptional repressor of NAD biosynthesis genes
MKKYKTGLVIGKFYPFHKGHEYLIESALKNSEKVTVIICQTSRYKIPVDVRAKWIKDTFPEVDVKVYRHSVELDSNSTDISKVWAGLTIKFLGFVPEAVFSSEEYGAPYAKYMGSQHVLVDLSRKHIPISATKIRSDMYRYWDFLPEITQKYFIRVVILGAESTGTTTLSRDLAEYFRTPWVPEYGRTYYEGKMTSKNLNSWQTSEFIHIAKIQNQMENNLAKQANKLLICDTNSFATELWHERYVGFMSNRLKKVSSKANADLYVLTDTDIPFVQDGTRDGEHIRQNMHNRFLQELQKRKLKYIVVSGSREKRLKESILAIAKL